MEVISATPSQWIFRAVLAVLGVITGGIFYFYCYRMAFFVLGNYLDAYDPSFPIEEVHKTLLGSPRDAVLYLRWLPALWLALVLLPRAVFGRCKWVVVGVYISQFVATRAFEFLLEYFHNYHDSPHIVATFAEIRQEMTTLERWIYSPLVDLLERGWGYWAVALHSIVLGAFWMLVVYAVYRLVRGAVRRRRVTEDVPLEDPA